MHNREAIEMMRRCVDDIKQLRRRIDELAPKAEAYDMLKKVLLVLLPSDRGGMGEDLVYTLERRVKELEKEEADAKAEKGTGKPKPQADEMVDERMATLARMATLVETDPSVRTGTSEAMRKIGYNEDGV